MELLTATTRCTVERDVGLTLLAQHLALLSEGRVQAMQIPVLAPGPAVLHLVLGAQDLALLEPEATVEQDAGGAGAREGVEQPPIGELFPDFDLPRSSEAPPPRPSWAARKSAGPLRP